MAEGSAPVAPRHQDADVPPGRWRDPRDFGVRVAIRREGRVAAAEARRPGARQGSFRDARLHGLPLHGRRFRQAGRHVRRQPEPRRREGQLRLPGALGAQSAPALRALLQFRKEGPDRRGLRAQGTALRIRPGAQQVSQRRPRTAGAADDSHAEPAPDRGRSARYRELPAHAQARQRHLPERGFHGRPRPEE